MKSYSIDNSNNFSFLSTSASNSRQISFSDQAHIKVKFILKTFTVFGTQIKVLGNIRELGNWDLNFSIPLFTTSAEYPIWTSKPIKISQLAFPIEFEYKYIMSNSEVIWESFERNRKAIVRCKTSNFYCFEIWNDFNYWKSEELVIESRNQLVEKFFLLGIIEVLEVQISELICVMQAEKEKMNNTLLQMCKTIITHMHGNNHFASPALFEFITWCLNELNPKSAKLLLNAFDCNFLELPHPSSTLLENIEKYEQAIKKNQNNDMIAISLSSLRKAIFYEPYEPSKTKFLVLSDSTLYKREKCALEEIIENLTHRDIWKITMVGKWICEMFQYNFTNPSQISVIKAQFEKLEKLNNLEVLRDLLYEMFEMALEMYIKVSRSISHQDCEVLAYKLKTEYKILNSDILQICSDYLLKSIPYINKALKLSPFLCYSAGTCEGYLFKYSNLDTPDLDQIIINVYDPSEFMELEKSTVGIVANSIRNIFIPLLLEAKEKKIPVSVGFFPPSGHSKYFFTVSEDKCTFAN